MMDEARAARIVETLLRKTVANGCTPAEAAEARARVALFVRRYGVGCVAKPRAASAPPPHTAPAHASSESEYAAWRAQFGTTPYRYAHLKPRRPRINVAPYLGFALGGFWLVVLVGAAWK